MFYSFPNIAQDSLSIYIKAVEHAVRPDPLRVDFGRFEYLPVESNDLFFAIDSVFLEGVSNALPGKAGLHLPVSGWETSSVFLLFSLCFVFFSLVVYNTRGAFIVNFKNKLSLRKNASIGHKMQVTTAEVWGEFFMLFQTILISSIVIFVYLIDHVPIASAPGAYLIGFSVIFLILAVFAGLKFLMYKAISSFFLTTELVRWRGHYYGHLQFMGILLFLPALCFVFLQECRDIMIPVLLSLFFINRVMVVFSLLNIFVKNKVGSIYFILYLCGTEIAPYLIFYKGVLSIVNFAGNY